LSSVARTPLANIPSSVARLIASDSSSSSRRGTPFPGFRNRASSRCCVAQQT
jgi:hypothetical protein